jgi:hypothetical protein
MKILSIELDANWRSTVGVIDVPLHKISETESISQKQPAVNWYVLEINSDATMQRTAPNYSHPGGAFEAHNGDVPHFNMQLTGYLDSVLQDGSTTRYAPGDLHYTRAMALHHSHLRSPVPNQHLLVTTPGGPTDPAALKVIE